MSYENLRKSMSSNITIEQYIEAVKEQSKKVEGMTFSFHEDLETVKLGETEFTRVVCDTGMNGTTMTQVYYLRKLDGYMALVIATITSEYTIADIEAMFS